MKYQNKTAEELKVAIIAMLFVISSISIGVCQGSVDIGLFDGGNNQLEVRLRPSSDFDGILSNIEFTIRWESASGARLGAIDQVYPEVAYSPMAKSGNAILSNGYNYQVFAGFGFNPMNVFNYHWTSGQEIVLLRIPVINGLSKFEIVNDSWTSQVKNNGDYYVSLGGKNFTGTIYHPTVDFCNNFTFDSNIDEIDCFGEHNGSIAISLSGGTLPYNFIWSNNSTANALNNLYPGTYSVTITDAMGCKKIESFTLDSPEEIPTPLITVRGDTLFSNSQLINQWYFNGNPIPGADKPYYIVTENGNYQLVVSNANGCSNSSDILHVIASAINNLTLDYSIQIYPNPTDGKFVLKFNSDIKSTYRLELSNTIGQVIYSTDLKDYTGEFVHGFDLTEYSKGMYNLNIQKENDKSNYKIMFE